MKLSIVIPTYNAEPYLVRCLTSCINQNLPLSDYEIIVINDGSIDGSLTVATEMAQNYSNIQVFSQKNQGLSMARNNGVAKATGEFVWFVDADDWIEKNCLSDIFKICTENGLDMLSFCASDVKDGTTRRRFNYMLGNKVVTGKEVLDYAIFPPCAPFSVYRKKFLVDNGLCFYPGIFHEDSEFQPRAYYFATRVCLVDDIYYYVYHSPNSIGRSYNPKKAFDQIIVMRSLDKFVKAHRISQKGFFYRLGLVLNNSISEALVFDKDLRNEFQKEINNNKDLLGYLWKSGLLKYKLEFVLFSIFSNRYIQIYKLLKKL